MHSFDFLHVPRDLVCIVLPEPRPQALNQRVAKELESVQLSIVEEELEVSLVKLFSLLCPS